MSVQLRKHESTREGRPNSLYTPNKSGESIVSRAKSLKIPVKVTVKRSESFGHGAIEELVKCAICMERLNQPKMLPCQHTFCLSCLQTYVTNKNFSKNAMPTLGEIKEALNVKQLTLECPNCRSPYTFDNGIEGLEQLPANIYIDSLLDGLNFGARARTSSRVNCVKCETVCHDEEEICKHCKLSFCKVCWVKHAQEIGAKVNDFTKGLEDMKTRLDYKNQDFKMQCEVLEADVKEGAEERIHKIREMESKVLEEIKILYNDGSYSQHEFKEKIDLLLEKVEDFAKKNTLDHSEKVLSYMRIHKEFSYLDEELSSFGETSKTFNAETFKLEETDPTPITDVDTVQNLTLTSDEDKTENNYKKRDFAPKLVWNKCPKSAGVAVPDWKPELIYVAATDSKTVLILNRSNKKIVEQLKHPDMLCPHSITFSNESEEVFVSDKWGHCIHVFARNGDYVRCIASRGSREGEVLSPHGIAMKNANEIIVCDTGNNRVLILDANTGEQVGVIGKNVTKNEFKTPTDVKVADNKIYIADAGNYRIKIYDFNGKKLNEFGSMGKNKAQFRCAEVVAVDPCGFMVVGDSANARLQIFNPEGNVVRMYGKADKFKWISGIHITPELDIIVTDHKNKCLFIF